MAFGAEIQELIVALRLDDSRFSGNLNNATRSLRGMDAGMRQMGRGAGQLGAGLARVGTIAAAAAGGGLFAVVKTAASFEQAFTGVEKTVDATEAEFAQLEETMRDMATETGTAFEELARIGEIGGALGVGVTDLEAFIDVVNRLAVSTDLTVDSAATALGQLRTVLDLSDTELRGVADTLVALGNAGASTEPQIVDLAARFAIAGDRAGLSTDEILALSSAVTSMGVEVEAGGTALSKTFNDIAVAIGTGGKEVEAFTSLLGVNAAEFERRWRRDALGTFQEWLRELSALDPIAQAVQLEMAGITGARQQAAIGAIASNWEFVGEQLEITKDDTGALAEESDKFFATTARKWEILKQNVRDAAATIGTELLPIVNDAMGDLVDWLQEAETQRGITDFAKELATGVKELADGIREVDWDPIIGGLQAAGTVAKGVFDIFKSLPGPLQGILVGGLTLNKLSGGLLGKGLGNIVVGAIKMRGSSPANPMFVSDVTGGLGGRGLGGAGGAGGGIRGAINGGGFVGGLARGTALASPLLAGVAAVEVKNFMDMREEATGKLEDILDDMPRDTGQEIDRSISKIESQIDQDRPFLEGILFNTNVRPVLEEELAELKALRRTTPDAPPGTVSAATMDQAAIAASFDEALTQNFAPKLEKLATNEVIQHLARTNEIGLDGVGTSFQQGITDGLDPIGDVATRILARAEDPQAPAVMHEIQGHLSGLEEIQAAYLASGDVKLAEKVQANIDTLHTLIGTVDSSNAVLEHRAAEATAADTAMLGSVDRVKAEIAGKGAQQLAMQSQALAAARGTTSEVSRLANTPHNVNVQNNVTVPVSISATVLANQMYRQSYTRSSTFSRSTNTGGI